MTPFYWPLIRDDTTAITWDWMHRQRQWVKWPEYLLWTASGRAMSPSGINIEAAVARQMVSQVSSVTLSGWFEAGGPSKVASASPAQREKNAAAIRLIESWLADESGYDEAVWPIVKAAIEDNRLSDRSRFGE